MLCDAAHIVAINQYTALSYIVEACYKAGNSAFARTGRPYNRQGLPGIDVQVKIVQHRQIGAVPECNIAEFNLTAYLGQAILLEASLSFLGLGVSEPTAAWGLMLRGAAVQFAEAAPWMAIFPGLAISLAVFAFNLFGDSLRDALDPRLRTQ